MDLKNSLHDKKSWQICASSGITGEGLQELTPEGLGGQQAGAHTKLSKLTKLTKLGAHTRGPGGSAGRSSHQNNHPPFALRPPRHMTVMSWLATCSSTGCNLPQSGLNSASQAGGPSGDLVRLICTHLTPLGGRPQPALAKWADRRQMGFMLLIPVNYNMASCGYLRQVVRVSFDIDATNASLSTGGIYSVFREDGWVVRLLPPHGSWGLPSPYTDKLQCRPARQGSHRD
eukprot:4322237-Pyramimonas_sp.AAC.2